MAVFDHTPFASARHPSMLSVAAYRVVDFIEHNAMALRRHIIRKQTERVLYGLSDAQLHDIGLERYAIPEFCAETVRKYG